MVASNIARSFARNCYRKVLPPLDRIVFLHLPKCGGTSIDFALENAYKKRFHKTIHLDPQQSKLVSDMFDEPLETSRSMFLAYHIADGLRHYRYVSGHYVFDERIWEAFADTWKFMTVLREPTSRWYSNYFYNRYKTNSEHMRINESLAEFVQTERAQKEGSAYVQYLTNHRDSADAVERAIENLNQFHLVGLLEEMDVLTQDLQKLVGVHVKIPRKRVSPRPAQSRSEEITPDIQEQVLKLCEPDRHIYDAMRAKILRQNTWLTP